MTRFNSYHPRTLAEAKRDLGVTTEIDSGGKPHVWYYVETSYRPKGITDFVKFQGHLVWADRPKNAERKAIEQTIREHGSDMEVEYFMSRRLTEAKAQKILDAFNAGSWEGWRF